MKNILFFNRVFYADSSNGASVANRSLAAGLARLGFRVEVICGTVCESAGMIDPLASLRAFDPQCRVSGAHGVNSWVVGSDGLRALDVPCLESRIDGVSVTTLNRPPRRGVKDDVVEAGELLAMTDAAMARGAEVLVTYGGDATTREVLARARRLGIRTVFVIHNFAYRDAAHFKDVDVVAVPSRFSAEHHKRIANLDCVVLPNLVDVDRVHVERPTPRYVTFVNASPEKGVFPFARIAHDLGRRRPDIPILVVESRGTERTLVACGVDLRDHGNVSLMSHTPEPRDFWRVTRICLMPSLWMESHGLVAVEAMLNGIPVIASDRGALPETLGDAGILLPLPARLTPASRELPTSEEVKPWVDAIIRLWDDESARTELASRAVSQARRWSREVVESSLADLFGNL